jgi:hypothetical protein
MEYDSKFRNSHIFSKIRVQFQRRFPKNGTRRIPLQLALALTLGIGFRRHSSRLAERLFLRIPQTKQRKVLKCLFKSAINCKKIAFIIVDGEMI